MLPRPSILLLATVLAVSSLAACGGDTAPPADSAAALQVTGRRVELGAGTAVPPPLAAVATSPDGARTARLVAAGEGLESARYRLELSAAGGAPVVVGEVINPFGLAWSPDGSWLAFSEGAVVEAVAAAGGAPVELFAGAGGPYPGAAFDLAWSPDGAELSFTLVFHAGDQTLADPRRVTLSLATP